MMDTINFPKILPPPSAAAGIKRVERRQDQNQRQPFQKALQKKNKKKKKQAEAEEQIQPEDSSESRAAESVTEFGDAEGLTVDEDAAGQRRMSAEPPPKKLIDVHV